MVVIMGNFQIYNLGMPSFIEKRSKIFSKDMSLQTALKWFKQILLLINTQSGDRILASKKTIDMNNNFFKSFELRYGSTTGLLLDL